MSNPANRASARAASSATKDTESSDAAPPPGLPVVGGMLTANGLVWDNDDDLTEEAGRAIAATLVAVKRSLVPWNWGDLLVRAHRKWGDQLPEWTKDSGLTIKTLRNYRALAEKFPRSRRREKLSIGHHDAVAGLPVADADRLLMEAEAGGLSLEKLRALLKPKDDDDGDDEDRGDDADDIGIVEWEEPLTVEEIFVPLASAIQALHEIKRSKVHPKDLIAYLRRENGKKKKESISATARIVSRVIRQPGDNLAVVLRRFLAPLVELGKQLEAEQRKQWEAERKQAEAEQVANVIPAPETLPEEEHEADNTPVKESTA